MDHVTEELNDGVLVVTMIHPPVNALSQGVRRDVLGALQRAAKNPDVQAVVLMGQGMMFCGGADISEFNEPMKSPDQNEVSAALENSEKPTVAAIHGKALGGGLEIALGAHYRIITSDAEVGLPEVKLGLLPGGGGTQRLTRLVGPEIATDLITTGRFIKASDALKHGIVDEVAAGELKEDAIAAAKRLVGKPVRRSRDTQTGLAGGTEVFTRLRQDVTKAAQGRQAPLLCLDAIEVAFKMPFDKAMIRERELFEDAWRLAESRALIHVFFSERASGKVAGLPKETRERPVKTVAIVGAGTMGGGIAMAFVNVGLPVTLIENSPEALKKGLERISGIYESSVSKGRMTAEQMQSRMALISPSTTFEDVASADLIIEAVFEEMSLKREIFRKLDTIAKAGAVLASNTSFLNIDTIAAETSRPQDVIGLHFFSPANVMRLLEVVRGAKTAPDVILTAMKVARTIKKLPVLVGVCDGFVGNRMFAAYTREAEFLVEEGASPAQVDKVLTDFGFAMGPLAVLDLAGLDIMWRSAKDKQAAGMRDPNKRHPEIGFALAERGHYGQKTGSGFYIYDASRKATPDPEIDAIAADLAKARGIPRRTISDTEILERCLYALINEGAHILEEGIAQRSSDIDMIYLNGYGFPAIKGGPMHWAGEVGLAKVLKGVQERAAADPAWWKTAPALERLAASGQTFTEAYPG